MIALWRWGADTVVLVHYGFLAYLIVGGFLAWRWRRTIWLHLMAATWAVLIVVAHLECPLTALQNALRSRAGQARVSGGFIDTYVRGTFFPAHERYLAQAVVGVIVLASWVGYAYALRRGATRPSPASRDPHPHLEATR